MLPIIIFCMILFLKVIAGAIMFGFISIDSLPNMWQSPASMFPAVSIVYGIFLWICVIWITLITIRAVLNYCMNVSQPLQKTVKSVGLRMVWRQIKVILLFGLLIIACVIALAIILLCIAGSFSLLLSIFVFSENTITSIFLFVIGLATLIFGVWFSCIVICYGISIMAFTPAIILTSELSSFQTLRTALYAVQKRTWSFWAFPIVPFIMLVIASIFIAFILVVFGLFVSMSLLVIGSGLFSVAMGLAQLYAGIYVYYYYVIEDLKKNPNIQPL